MSAVSSPYEGLTKSSKRAIDWAAQLAAARGGEIDSTDVLLGLFFAHPTDSEPMQLLDHFQIPAARLTAGLTRERRLSPTARPPIPAVGLGSSVSLPTDALRVLEAGIGLARDHKADQDLARVRDLFGAMLKAPESSAGQLLAQLMSEQRLPVILSDLGSEYDGFLDRGPHASYRAYLDETRRWTPSGPRYATFDADVVRRVRPSGEGTRALAPLDWVGIGAEVDAFAYLIAARTLVPPLAIGLFGDWGSGKSFFMQALQRRVFEITAEARETGKPQRDLGVYKSVIQIDFNAWHYVDGDLWASLVEHIFRNLRAAADDGEAELAKRSQELFAQIQGKKQHLIQVRGDIDRQRQALAKAKGERHDLQAERRKAQQDLSEVRAAATSAIRTVIEQNKEAVEKVGIPVAASSVTEFVAAATEARATLRRGAGLSEALRRRDIRWVAPALVLLVVTPVVVSWLLTVGGSSVTTNLVTTVATFLAFLAGMVRAASGWANQQLDAIEKAQVEVERVRAEEETKRATAQAAVERAERDLAAQQEAEASIAAEVERLEGRLARIGPADVLSDFIDNRIGSDDYRKHLGVAALVRRDFELLSDLVADSNDAFVKADDGTTVPTSDVHRVVLYVDDLDRCPPEVVVRVLQAVHLLLAFPLFVVVVAVDARWLTQSLQQHYGELLGGRNGSGDPRSRVIDNGLSSATPDDYLEKIFQIPFWVQPLGTEARVRMVNGLVTPSLAWEVTNGEAQTVSSDAAADEASREAVAELVERLFGTASETPRANPESLLIRPHELRSMEQASPILGASPRAVKRFVNEYRLLKVINEASDADMFAADTPGAPYRWAILMLAVVTGLPEISPQLCRAILDESKGADPLSSVVDSLVTDPGGDSSDEMARLKAFLGGSGKELASVSGSELAPFVRQIARFSFQSETAISQIQAA